MTAIPSPYISVIVVAYNYANYLTRTLQALRAQTFDDFEIVIVNNGSTDNSQALIDQFIKDNPQLQVSCHLVKTNIGLPNGRNVGIQAAKGEFLTFNDADDWMDADCLEVLARTARETGSDRVLGAFREVDENGKVLRVCNYAENQSPWLFTALQNVMFRRSLLIENNFICPLNTRMDDIFTNISFTQYSRKFALSSRDTFNYFVNQNSTSGAKNNNKSWNSTTLIQDCFDTFMPLYRNCQSEEDRMMLEYVLVKQYYFYLFHNNRYVNLGTALRNYKAARSIAKSCLPDYLKNPNIKKNPNGDRPSGRKLVRLFTMFERFHVMPLVWIGFLIASRLTYLNP